jgi:hypothetical protein
METAFFLFWQILTGYLLRAFRLNLGRLSQRISTEAGLLRAAATL